MMMLVWSLAAWLVIVSSAALVFVLALECRAPGARGWGRGVAIMAFTGMMAGTLIAVAVILRRHGVPVEALLPERLDGYVAWFTLLVAHLTIMMPVQMYGVWRDQHTAQERRGWAR